MENFIRNKRSYYHLLLFLLLQITGHCLLPSAAAAQKTKVEFGLQAPYGGKREITYKDSVPVELKEFDIVGNLCRYAKMNNDTLNRLTLMEERVYDEHQHLLLGYIKTVVYQDSLDFGGKTIFRKFDSAIKKFIVVKPLTGSYEQAMITNPPDTLGLPLFYKQYADAFGIPVVASAKVPGAALLVARDIVNYMLQMRFDVRQELIKRRSRVLVMAETEMETDLPEHRNWKKPARSDSRLTPGERDSYDRRGGIGSMSDKQYWNQRARGMGGNEVSCAEENLLGYAGTKYFGENILVHEFSHNIMSALATVDTALYNEIKQAYAAAKAKNLYKNQYAINTVAEYWAEGTQWWFWCNVAFEDNATRLRSPDDLKAYDPALYHILEQVYAGHHIPADVYYQFNIQGVQ